MHKAWFNGRMSRYILIMAVLALVLLSSANPLLAQPAGAIGLAIGASARGNLNPNKGAETYSISLSAPGALRVDVNSDATLSYRLFLYDTNGVSELNRHEGGTATARFVARPDLNPGTYFVRVERLSGQGDFNIRATLTPPSAQPDREPNDTANEAIVLGVNSRAAGLLGYYSGGRTDTVDWYVVNTAASGELEVKVTAEQTLGTRIFLYDANSVSELRRHEGGTSTERTVSRPDLRPGKYFVRVERTTGYGAYSISATLAPNPKKDDPEPNDNADTAVNISPGSTATGLLGYYSAGTTDTVDYYKVTTTRPGTLEVTVTTDPTLSFRMFLYDTNKVSELHRNEGGTMATRSVARPDLNPGTYYVMIQRMGGHGGYTISPVFTPQPLETDKEPNDVVDEAVALEPGKSYTGQLGYYSGGRTDGMDYYKITIPRAGALQVSVTSDTSLSYRLFMYDTNKVSELNRSEGGTPTSRSVVRPDLNPGTYYVMIQRMGGYGGYTISPVFTPQPIEADKEPNNSSAEATEIQANKPSTGQLGYVSGTVTDTVDCYKVNMWTHGTLTFTVEADSTLGFRIFMYDVNGVSELRRNEGGSHAVRSVTRPDLAPGTYYLRIERTGGHGGYTVMPMAVPNPVLADTEPNDNHQTATPLKLNETNWGIMGFNKAGTADRVDYYSVNLQSGGTLTVSTAGDGSLNLRAFLYDTNGVSEIRRHEGGSTSVRTLSHTGLKPGTYYVRLEMLGGHGGYAITATASESGSLLNPSSRALGFARVGEDSPAVQFAVVNLGAEPLVVSSVAISGANSTEFRIVSDEASGQTIAPRAARAITIAAKPTSEGRKQATLTVRAGSQTLTATLEAMAFSDIRQVPVTWVPGQQLAAAALPPTMPSSGSGPTMSLDRYAARPGEKVTLTYSGAPGFANDWVTLVPVSAPESQWNEWYYLHGQQRGTIEFTVPTAPGEYEVRMFKDWPAGGTSIVGKSPGLTVGTTAPAARPDASQPPADRVRPSMALDRSRVEPKGKIVLSYEGATGGAGDWVTIASAGSPPSTWTEWRTLGAAKSGRIELMAPDTAGSYEVRMFKDWPASEGNLIGRSPVFTVAAEPARPEPQPQIPSTPVASPGTPAYGPWMPAIEDFRSVALLDQTIAWLEDAIARATAGRSAHPSFLEDLRAILAQLKAARAGLAAEYKALQ